MGKRKRKCYATVLKHFESAVDLEALFTLVSGNWGIPATYLDSPAKIFSLLGISRNNSRYFPQLALLYKFTKLADNKVEEVTMANLEYSLIFPILIKRCEKTYSTPVATHQGSPGCGLNRAMMTLIGPSAITMVPSMACMNLIVPSCWNITKNCMWNVFCNYSQDLNDLWTTNPNPQILLLTTCEQTIFCSLGDF